jgi:hypothetical protein
VLGAVATPGSQMKVGGGARRQIRDWIYDIALRRGFSPYRLLIPFYLISVFAFHTAYEAGSVVPSKSNSADSMMYSRGLPPPAVEDELRKHRAPIVDFNPWIYSLELTVPLITLDQKQNWLFSSSSYVERRSSPTLVSRVFERLARVLVWADPIIGWIISFFIVGQLTGLVRSRSE